MRLSASSSADAATYLGSQLGCSSQRQTNLLPLHNSTSPVNEVLGFRGQEAIISTAAALYQSVPGKEQSLACQIVYREQHGFPSKNRGGNGVTVPISFLCDSAHLWFPPCLTLELDPIIMTPETEQAMGRKGGVGWRKKLRHDKWKKPLLGSQI
ncbi:hypothetical protein OPV22_004001 [Ensete ventricosum]|uniref:Uncharacterized protein n=1 Tax=Ensete ventricosum TaxID=4639 RepID=A0AAV8S274_ENSVE|nr:hypothetical protein OPV22_004001 [Ensete ventricosum]